MGCRLWNGPGVFLSGFPRLCRIEAFNGAAEKLFGYEAAEVLAVPITAIGTDDLGTFVMVVDDKGVVHRTSVVTGIRDGAQVELQSGVEQGQLVVAKAASFVREGDVVDPVPLAAVPVTN